MIYSVAMAAVTEKTLFPRPQRCLRSVLSNRLCGLYSVQWDVFDQWKSRPKCVGGHETALRTSRIRAEMNRARF